MNIIEKLLESFQKFPGIGPRQARRFVDFLIKENSEEIKKLTGNILEFKRAVKKCSECGYSFIPTQNADKCQICRSPGRKKSSLLIVEKDVDLENIEKANVYQGRYYVLGATINALNGEEATKKRFKELFNYVKKASGEIKEIIIATSATTEGEATATYLERILEPITKAKKIKISRLGRGLSTGTELEYSDSATIKNALQNRK